MTAQHTLRLPLDVDFDLAVEWTLDGVPVDVVSARLVVAQGAVRLEVPGVVDEPGRILIAAERPDLEASGLVPGTVAEYVLAVEVAGRTRRLLEGPVSIPREVLTW